MIASPAATKRFNAATDLYHGVPVRFRTRRNFTRMRLVCLLSNGRAWIVVFERNDSGEWDAHPEIVNADDIRRSSDSFEPPPLPDYLRGPECPRCGAWPLDHHGGDLWFCNSCLRDVAE